MSLKITHEKDNMLFKRKEIEGEITVEASPSRHHILEILSEKFKAKKDAIKIKKIKGRFGTKEFKVIAYVYHSKADKDSVELKKKKETDAEAKEKEHEQKHAEEHTEKHAKKEEAKEIKEEEAEAAE